MTSTTVRDPPLPQSLKTSPACSAALAISLCLASFTLYLCLIKSYPAVYWYDAHIRLALRDQIFVGRWLPLTQTLIFTASSITSHLLVVRSFLAMAAVVALASMYRLAAKLFSPATGLMATALLAVNLMFAALATVAYPDVLFVGLLMLALALLADPGPPRRWTLTALVINLACLTRYEGWMLAALLIAEATGKSLRSQHGTYIVRATLKATLLFGSSAILWSLLGPAALETNETRALERASVQHWYAYGAQFFALLRQQARPEILGLGLIGGWLAWRSNHPRRIHRLILVFVILDVAVIGLLQPWPFGNLRQTFVTLVFVILYAAYGMVRLIRVVCERLAALVPSPSSVSLGRWATTGAALLFASTSIPSATKFVAGAAREPDFYVPAQIGEWLRGRLTEDDSVWALSDSLFQPYALATYAHLPFDDVLDDRLAIETIRSRLSSSRLAYIVELYESREGLSVVEQRLLNDLETGRIQAQWFAVDTTRVWVVPTNMLLHPP